MAGLNGGTRGARVDADGEGAGDAPHRQEIRHAGVREVRAEQVSIEQAAVLRLEATTARADQVAIGVLRAQRATVRESNVGSVIAGSAACDRTRVGILAAPVVRGDVHTWLDLRTAFAAGLGLAVGSFVLSLTRGLAQRARS